MAGKVRQGQRQILAADAVGAFDEDVHHAVHLLLDHLRLVDLHRRQVAQHVRDRRAGVGVGRGRRPRTNGLGADHILEDSDRASVDDVGPRARQDRQVGQRGLDDASDVAVLAVGREREERSDGDVVHRPARLRGEVDD